VAKDPGRSYKPVAVGKPRQTFRCAFCGRHEVRINRQGNGRCDWCHTQFMTASELTLSDKEHK
jgi:ribosomal protein L37AE/L43A